MNQDLLHLQGKLFHGHMLICGQLMMHYHKLYEMVVSNINAIDHNKLLTFDIKTI